MFSTTSTSNGCCVTLSYADQVGPTAQKAVQAGIPTVAFNSGIGEYSKYDIGMYFGSDEDLAGQTAGQKMTAAGGGKTQWCRNRVRSPSKPAAPV